MTDTPDDLPSPDEYRKKMPHVDQEFADARRYLSALCAEDNQALGALMAEIHRSGRAMKVLAAMAVQALDFAQLSADRLSSCACWYLRQWHVQRGHPAGVQLPAAGGG
jgi:hypothetical protein